MIKQKVRNLTFIVLLFTVALLCLTFTFTSNCMSQVPYFYPQYPMLLPVPYFPLLPVYSTPPLPYFPPVYPYALPAPITRAPAATIIITNPTTGTVSVTTTTPATTTAPTATVAPLISSLVTLYAGAIYSPTPISVANPLLFAYLSSLLI